MKTSKFILLGLLFVAGFGMNACKKCTVADADKNTGQIVDKVVVYPTSGYLTSNLDGNYHITGDSDFAEGFQVSFDGGITKVDVDWNTYDLLANPMLVSCKASFIREVTYNYGNNTVFYNVIANTCESCDPERFVENWVLVPKIPENFVVYYDTEIKHN
jgi:hypothetical protein